jgi:hypothetical protein
VECGVCCMLGWGLMSTAATHVATVLVLQIAWCPMPPAQLADASPRSMHDKKLTDLLCMSRSYPSTQGNSGGGPQLVQSAWCHQPAWGPPACDGTSALDPYSSSIMCSSSRPRDVCTTSHYLRS